MTGTSDDAERSATASARGHVAAVVLPTCEPEPDARSLACIGRDREGATARFLRGPSHQARSSTILAVACYAISEVRFRSVGMFITGISKDRDGVSALALSPPTRLTFFHADDAGPEGRVPASRLRVGGQRERVVGHPHVDSPSCPRR